MNRAGENPQQKKGIISHVNSLTDKVCVNVSSYLHMTFLHLSVLDMFPQMVTDGSEGGMDLYTEVTPVANRSLLTCALHLQDHRETTCSSHTQDL